MRIVDAAGKTERLEAGVGVHDDVAPGIVVELLGDAAVVEVDDQFGAAEVVANEAVGSFGLRGRIDFDQVGRDVGFVGIDKAADDLAVAVEFANWVDLSTETLVSIAR